MQFNVSVESNIMYDESQQACSIYPRGGKGIYLSKVDEPLFRYLSELDSKDLDLWIRYGNLAEIEDYKYTSNHELIVTYGSETGTVTYSGVGADQLMKLHRGVNKVRKRQKRHKK